MLSKYDIMGISGSGTNYDVLEEAGVADSDVFISVTESDETNIISCIFAKNMGAKYTGVYSGGGASGYPDDETGVYASGADSYADGYMGGGPAAARVGRRTRAMPPSVPLSHGPTGSGKHDDDDRTHQFNCPRLITQAI